MRSSPVSSTAPDTDRPHRLEQIDEAAVVQLYADGFAGLATRDKILVWHLYQAALAGRDIYYDQRYRHSLAMRDILEEIVAHADGVRPAMLAELTRYTKLFWINSGPYNNLTARKFVLHLTEAELIDADDGGGADRRPVPARRRRNPCGSHPALCADVLRCHPTIRWSRARRRAAARDILEASANNLYDGVTMADLDGFVERHPLNSRLVKRNGHVIEEVYRVGGLYDAEIRAIVEHLEAAMPYAPDELGVGAPGTDRLVPHR